MRGLSPDLLAAQIKEPTGPEQFEEQKARIAPLFKGMQVVARKALADDKVELKYKQDWDAAMAQLNPRMPEFFVQPMAKVGGARRISGSTRGYQPEWDSDARVQTFIQDVGGQP